MNKLSPLFVILFGCGVLYTADSFRDLKTQQASDRSEFKILKDQLDNQKRKSEEREIQFKEEANKLKKQKLRLEKAERERKKRIEIENQTKIDAEAKRLAEEKRIRSKKQKTKVAKLNYFQSKVESSLSGLDKRVFNVLQCNAEEGSGSIVHSVSLYHKEVGSTFIDFKYTFKAKYGFVPYESYVKGRISVDDGKFSFVKFQNDINKKWIDISPTCY